MLVQRDQVSEGGVLSRDKGQEGHGEESLKRQDQIPTWDHD